MAKPLFIAFYPSDWRAGVANLSTVERALYHEICMVIWETGQGVKERDISRLLRDDPEVLHDALEALIRFGKVVRDGDELVNERAMQEYENAQGRRASGRKGAAKRWGKDATASNPHMLSHCDSMQSAYASQSQSQKPDVEPEPENPQTHRARARPDPHAAFEASFDQSLQEFMGVLKNRYPWRTPQHTGQQKWREAEVGARQLHLQGHVYAMILMAVDRYKAFAEATGILHTGKTMMAATFMSDAENVENPWELPAEPRNGAAPGNVLSMAKRIGAKLDAEEIESEQHEYGAGHSDNGLNRGDAVQ